MSWAILGLLTIIVTVLVIGFVLIAYGVIRASQATAATLISFDQRASKERQAHREMQIALIDRIMSQNWESVRAYETAQTTEPGGFYAPEEQSEAMTLVMPRPSEPEEPYVEQTGPSWGSSSRVQERADMLDDAERLAQEDDLDSYSAERDRAS